MCLILFSLNQHPEYKLILMANRDEFYNRKTEAADYWRDHNTILGGRDLEAMRPDGSCGTWMAMTTSGKIAMITNYRDFKNLKTKAPSRGHLVSDFLIGNMDPESYLIEIEKTKHEYNGFNLLAGSVDQLYYQSNYKAGIDHLTSGLYGLSNHLLQTPWPKVELAKSKLLPVLSEQKINPEDLFSIMQDESRAREEDLPNTGIGVEREKALSSMFIKTNGYGTRCSTVVLVKNSGEVSFIERTYRLDDFTFESKAFHFRIT
jgi:uncharacterized protein with NRDE domain